MTLSLPSLMAGNRRLAARLALVLAVAMVPATTLGVGSAEARTPTLDERSAEKQMFDDHNVARSSPGSYGYGSMSKQSALRWSEDLAGVARGWSAEMAKTGEFRHNPRFGSQACCWTRIGENIARGSVVGSPDAVRATTDRLMRAWMNSTGHRNNIMDGRFSQVGIGVVIDSKGRMWATAVFRTPNSSAPAGTKNYPQTAAGSCSGRRHFLAGDWDGSGRDGIGWFCDGRFHLRAAGGTVYAFTYGTKSGDIPVVGDWNNNGRDGVGIFRRGGYWHLRNSLSSASGLTAYSFRYGTKSGDLPVVGDWNRNGRDGIGIFRRGGYWHLRNSLSSASGLTAYSFRYGTKSGDLPVVGDWNRNGRDGVGIFRRGGQWHLRDSLASKAGMTTRSFTYGRESGDRPVPGDWNGDGRDTAAIVRGDHWHMR